MRTTHPTLHLAAILMLPLLLIVTGPSARAQAGDGLHFKVITEDGKPVANAALAVAADNGGRGRGPVQQRNAWSGQGTTDAAGEATVDEFQRVPMSVTVTAAGFPPHTLHGLQPWLQPLFTITLPPGHTLTGTLKDDKGQPLAGAQISIQPPGSANTLSPDPLQSATTAPDGNWSLPAIAEGRYVLSAEIPSADGAFYLPPTPLLVTADPHPTSMPLTAQPGIIIKGQIIFSPEVDPATQFIRVYLRSPYSLSLTIPLEKDGHFEIRNIPQGALGQITANAVRGFYARPSWQNIPAGFIRNGDPEVSDITLDHPASGIYEGLKFEVLKCAKARGTVVDQDGNPIPNALIIIRFGSSGASTKDDGTYEADIPPHEKVSLQLASNGGLNRVTLPDFTAEPGQVIDGKDFKTIRRPWVEVPYQQSISGTVLDPTGQPALGATVYLGNMGMIPDPLASVWAPRRTMGAPLQRPVVHAWTGGSWSPAAAKSAPDGFSFDSLTDGTTDLWAYDPTLGWGIAQDIKSDAHDVKIQLTAQKGPVLLDGRITDTQDQPSPNARLYVLNPDVRDSVLLAQGQSNANGDFQLEVNPKPGNDASANPNLLLVCVPAKGALAWKWLPPITISHINLKLEPDALITGRITDQKQHPLANVAVRFAGLRHPAFGLMRIYSQQPTNPINAIGPSTTTDKDGRFELHGCPDGATDPTISFDTPGFTRTNVDFGYDVKEKRDLGDFDLTPDTIFEGTVRDAATGQPVPGATISSHDPVDHSSSKSDGSGHYQLSPGAFTIRALTIIDASSGQGAAELTGSITFSSQPRPGDQIHLPDLLLRPALARRQADWIAHGAPSAPPAPAVAVIEDLDPQSRGMSAYHDTLTFFDAHQKPTAQRADLNITATYYKRMTAIDPKDHALYVADPAHKLTRYKPDASIDWSKEGVLATALTLDPESSNLWVATGGAAENMILVFSPKGDILKTIRLTAWDIAYSPHDKSMWIGGFVVQKINLDGQVIAASPINYTNRVQYLAPDPTDGGCWVAESAENTGLPGNPSFILRLSPTARPESQIATNTAAYLAIDPARHNLWAIGVDGELSRMDLAGEHRQEIPIASTPASPTALALEAGTGCLWAAAHDAVYRIDPQGNCLLHLPSKEPANKWLALMPPESP